MYYIQTMCEVIIAIAAVKYLMPDIRKICKKISECTDADSATVKHKSPETTNQITDLGSANSDSSKDDSQATQEEV